MEKKVATMSLTPREWCLWTAGIAKGFADGVKFTLQNLDQSLNQMLTAAAEQAEQQEGDYDIDGLKTWVESFSPWITAMKTEGEKSQRKSNKQLDNLPSKPRNLRQRTVGAILGAISGFRKG